MPRGLRLDAPGTLHHVIVRGIEQGSIVRDDTDRKTFIDRMSLLAKGLGTGIYAFSLMTNHAHILLKSGPDGISKYMRCLLTGYAQYFNRRHKRAGHLFQNRYKSIICEEEAYFDKLVAYIHLNPLRERDLGTSINKTKSFFIFLYYQQGLSEYILNGKALFREGRDLMLREPCIM